MSSPVMSLPVTDSLSQAWEVVHAKRFGDVSILGAYDQWVEKTHARWPMVSKGRRPFLIEKTELKEESHVRTGREALNRPPPTI